MKLKILYIKKSYFSHLLVIPLSRPPVFPPDPLRPSPPLPPPPRRPWASAIFFPAMGGFREYLLFEHQD